jgi:hypothetical protein
MARTTAAAEEVEAMEGAAAAVARIRLYLEKAEKSESTSDVNYF